MSQDPKKELKEIEKLSIKEKLKQYRPEKKASKEVGEMGKPSLKAEFEDAMQKQYKSRPENQMEKKAPMGDKKKVSKLYMMTKLKY